MDEIKLMVLPFSHLSLNIHLQILQTDLIKDQSIFSYNCWWILFLLIVITFPLDCLLIVVRRKLMFTIDTQRVKWKLFDRTFAQHHLFPKFVWIFLGEFFFAKATIQGRKGVMNCNHCSCLMVMFTGSPEATPARDYVKLS